MKHCKTESDRNGKLMNYFIYFNWINFFFLFSDALQVLRCVSEENVRSVQQCAIGSFDVISQLADSNENRATILPKVCCLTHVAANCAVKKLAGITCDSANTTPGK